MGSQDLSVFVSGDPQQRDKWQTAAARDPTISRFYFNSSSDFSWNSADQSLQCVDPCSPSAWFELFFTGTSAMFFGNLEGREIYVDATFQISTDSSKPITHTWSDYGLLMYQSGQLPDAKHTIRMSNFTGTKGVSLRYALANAGLTAIFNETSTSMFVGHSINSSVVFDKYSWVEVERMGEYPWRDAITYNGTMAFTFDGVSISILGGPFATHSSYPWNKNQGINITLYPSGSSSPLIQETIFSSDGFGISPLSGYKTYFNHPLDRKASPYTVFITVNLDEASGWGQGFRFAGFFYQPAFVLAKGMAPLTLPSVDAPKPLMEDSGSSGISKSAIAGIAVGVFVVLFGFSILVRELLHRKRKKEIEARTLQELYSNSEVDYGSSEAGKLAGRTHGENVRLMSEPVPSPLQDQESGVSRQNDPSCITPFTLSQARPASGRTKR